MLFITPSLLGSTGDAVNERQLALACSKYLHVDVVYLLPVRRMIKLGEVRMFSQKYGIRVYPLPLPPLLFLMPLVSLMLAVFVALFWRTYDVIYVRFLPYAFAFTFFRKISNKTIAKTVAFLEEEIKLSRLSTYLLNLMERRVAQFVHKIAVPSPVFLLEFGRRRGVVPRGVLWLPAGIATDVVHNHPRDQKRRDVCFLGSFAWWQGVSNLVFAARLLIDRGHRLRLVLIGDGPLRQTVESLCRGLGVDCEITGFLPHDKALEVFSSRCALLVLPRLRTPVTESVVPIKLMEAWALGVPVVVTRHKVLEHLGLRDGVDVVYCEPEPRSVAEAIYRVLSDGELYERLSQRGPELARMFSYEESCKRLLAALGLRR